MSLSENDSNVKKFNTNIIQLMEELHKIDGGVNNILKFRDLIQLSVKGNAKLPSEFFLNFIEKVNKNGIRVLEKLLEKDLEFFKIPENILFNTRTETIEYVKKIIVFWSEIVDKEIMELVSNYLNLLIIYCIKIHNRKDLLDIVNKYRKNPIKL